MAVHALLERWAGPAAGGGRGPCGSAAACGRRRGAVEGRKGPAAGASGGASGGGGCHRRRRERRRPRECARAQTKTAAAAAAAPRAGAGASCLARRAPRSPPVGAGPEGGGARKGGGRERCALGVGVELETGASGGRGQPNARPAPGSGTGPGRAGLCARRGRLRWQLRHSGARLRPRAARRAGAPAPGGLRGAAVGQRRETEKVGPGRAQRARAALRACGWLGRQPLAAAPKGREMQGGAGPGCARAGATGGGPVGMNVCWGVGGGGGGWHTPLWQGRRGGLGPWQWIARSGCRGAPAGGGRPRVWGNQCVGRRAGLAGPCTRPHPSRFARSGLARRVQGQQRRRPRRGPLASHGAQRLCSGPRGVAVGAALRGPGPGPVRGWGAGLIGGGVGCRRHKEAAAPEVRHAVGPPRLARGRGAAAVHGRGRGRGGAGAAR
jgi:hypothetical protein